MFDRLNDLNFSADSSLIHLSPFLMSSIPRLLSESVSLLAYQRFYGDSHQKLLWPVNNVGFHDDKQPEMTI